MTEKNILEKSRLELGVILSQGISGVTQSIAPGLLILGPNLGRAC